MIKMHFAPGVLCLAASIAFSGVQAAAAQQTVMAEHGAQVEQSGQAKHNGQAGQTEPSSGVDPQAEAVRQRFSERYDGMPVTAVRRTPYGIFEVQLGMELVYTDAEVNWVMTGSLIDTASRKDLTAARMEALSAVNFADLPQHLAIKQVRGKGERKMAIFEDPNCGYCKQLHKEIAGLDNVTIYTYLFPILSSDSVEKSRNIWCAKDPATVLSNWMTKNTVPPVAQCDAPIQEVLALGQKLMVRGTPAIFFEKGKRSAGAIPKDQIEAYL